MEGTQGEEKVTEFQAHRKCVSSCGFLQQDKIVVTSSHDKTIALWDSSNGNKLHELCGHKHRVVSCSIDEHHERFLSASWDKSIIFWDVNATEALWSANHDSLVTSCHMSLEQHMAVSGTDNGAFHFWDTRTGKRVNKTNGHSNTITCCRFSHNGLNLCTCAMDYSALVWDVRTQKCLLKLRGHINTVSGCAFSHNDHCLVTSSWDKTLQVYDITSGVYRSKGPVVLRHHDGCVSACDYSNDDSLLASCGYDLDVNIWDMNSCKLKNNFRGHEGWIQDVKFGNDKKWVVTCAKDGMVRIWNTEGGKCYRMIRRKNMEIVKCEKCGKMFSLIEPLGETSLCLCVFCRLKNPSRSFEMFSEHLKVA